MTYNDIIEALKHQVSLAENVDGPYAEYVPKWILIETLALTSRQKAEIEELKNEVAKDFTCFVGDPHKVEHCPYLEELETTKAEAIKEFAKELTERFRQREQEKQCSWCKHSTVWGRRSNVCDMDNGNGRVRCFFYDHWESCVDNIVDNLVIEMVGDNNV